MVSLVRSDVVTPTGSSAIAIAADARARHAAEPFDPTAVGAFTHGTTSVETSIGPTLSSTTYGSATSMSSADLITACSTVLEQVNHNRLLINRLAYILEANGMTS